MEKQKKIQEIRRVTSAIKACNHPNILKCFDEFIIQDYYFILLEKCELSLKDWIEMNVDSQIESKTYINIALQILEGLKYLHSRDLYLKKFNLSNIFIDKANRIKFSNFQYENQQHNPDVIKFLLNSDQTTQILYETPEQLDEDLKQNCKQYQDYNYMALSDIWLVCLCLYSLAGGTLRHINNLTKKQLYLPSPKVQYQINLVLLNALQVIPILRPQIDDLIDRFKRIDISLDQSFKPIVTEDENQIFLKAQQLYEQDEEEDALKLFIQLLDLSPRNDLYLAWVGRIYNSFKFYEEAEYWSKQSLLLNPNNDVAYFNLGNKNRDQYKFKLAISYFQKAIQINPTNGMIFNNLGVCYQNILNYQAAQIVLKTALKLNPSKQYFVYNYGRNKFLMKKYEEGMIYLKKSLHLDPSDNESQFLIKQSKQYI